MLNASPPVDTSKHQLGTPFSPEQTNAITEHYNREGCVLIPGILPADLVAKLKAGVDRIFSDERAKNTDTLYGSYIAVRCFEWDNAFRDLLATDPILALMESIVGHDCHLIANNIVRNAPGQAIDVFHADPPLFMPLPEGVPRFDARMMIPTFIVNVQIALTDIDAIEFGPTQYVKDSHYSGRQPNHQHNPHWEENGITSILCKAGDIYLQHGQVWHRGAPNTATRTRYLLQQSYGMRTIAQRFFPFADYKTPAHVWDGAGERLQRVLGRHPKGAYG